MGEDGGVLKITAVNVNGIRAAYRKGMADWITANAPDVILISEVRAPDEIVTDLLGPEWNIVHQACEIKGRAGVAIASRLPVRAARVGLGTEPEVPVDTGRWVEADLELASGGLITVVSAYIHSGTAGTPKMDQKYAHLDRVNARMAELGASETPAMVGGDINIAHKEVDIKNWKGNLKSAGFLPEERAYLDRWFDEFGFARALVPTRGGPTAARPSPMTRAGASTIRSPTRRSPLPRAALRSAAPRPTTSAGATTHR